MDRRTLLGTVATGGAVSLAGCGVFEVTSGNSGASAREEQVAAANDHLERIFDTLAEYDILAAGEPAVDPEAYTPEDLGVLRQEFEGATTAVEELNEIEAEAATPAPGSEAVRGGVLLAGARLKLYERARNIAVQNQTALRELGDENYARASAAAEQVIEWAAVVAGAAQECGKIIERFRSESFSAPSFYRLEAAEQEQEAFESVDSTVGPAAAGVATTSRALTKGVAARELLAEDAYASADVAYQEALAAIDVAREQFGQLETAPAMFTQAYQRGSCGLDQLSEAYTTAREGASAAREGDTDRANDRLSTAETMLERYIKDCLEP